MTEKIGPVKKVARADFTTQSRALAWRQGQQAILIESSKAGSRLTNSKRQEDFCASIAD